MHVIVCYRCATRCSDNMLLYVVVVDICATFRGLLCYHVLSGWTVVLLLAAHSLLCVIMVDGILGTLSIPSVLCYQCYRVLSCVIVCCRVLSCVIVCYCVLSWWMLAIVLFPSLVTCVISVIVCYHVLLCVIVCYHGGCRPLYSFHP